MKLDEYSSSLCFRNVMMFWTHNQVWYMHIKNRKW